MSEVFFCPKCGRPRIVEEPFCPRCGTPLEQVADSDATPVATATSPHKRPWYFSMPMLVISFLFLTPLWTILILADDKHGKGTKIVASVLGAISVIVIVYTVLGAVGVSSLIGPGQVTFGSDYARRGNDVVIVGAKSSFTSNEQMAWVAHLNAPVNTTRLDVMVSQAIGSGAEQVIYRNPVDLAYPGFTLLFNKHTASVATLGLSGKFRLRILLGDTVLAVGEFEVQ